MDMMDIIRYYISRYNGAIKTVCWSSWIARNLLFLSASSPRSSSRTPPCPSLLPAPSGSTPATTSFASLPSELSPPTNVSARLCFSQTTLSSACLAAPGTPSLAFRLTPCPALWFWALLLFGVGVRLLFFTCHRRPGREGWLLLFIFCPTRLVVFVLFSFFNFQWVDPIPFNRQRYHVPCFWRQQESSWLLLFLFLSLVFRTRRVVFLWGRFFRSSICLLAFIASELLLFIFLSSSSTCGWSGGRLFASKWPVFPWVWPILSASPTPVSTFLFIER